MRFRTTTTVSIVADPQARMFTADFSPLHAGESACHSHDNTGNDGDKVRKCIIRITSVAVRETGN